MAALSAKASPRPAFLLSSFTSRACCLSTALSALYLQARQTTRPFTSSHPTLDWLSPRSGESSKSRKGRPRVPTGGSVKGTTLVWGDYGIRLRDTSRRISSAQLKIADETIKKRLRGMKYRIYHRVSANIGVYTSGNDQRMGKGKGSFDYWSCRVPVSRVVFELKGEIHEQIVRDAFRLAGNKLPGQWEFVKKGDPPVMGITKLGNGITEEMLRRPRMPVPAPSLDSTAARLPAATPPTM